MEMDLFFSLIEQKKLAQKKRQSEAKKTAKKSESSVDGLFGGPIKVGIYSVCV